MRFLIVILLSAISWTVTAQNGKAELYNYLTKCNNSSNEITTMSNYISAEVSKNAGTIVTIPQLKNGGGGGIKITTAPQFKYPDDFKKPESKTGIEGGTTIFFPDGSIKELAKGSTTQVTIFNGENPVTQLKNGGGGGIKITTAPQFKYPDDFKKPDEKNGGNMAQPGMDMANMMMANMMMTSMQQQNNQSVVIFLNTTNPANPSIEIIRGQSTQKVEELNTVLKGKTGYILTEKK